MLSALCSFIFPFCFVSFLLFSQLSSSDPVLRRAACDVLANRALSAEGCTTLLQVGALHHLLGHFNDLDINVSIAAVGAVRVFLSSHC